MVKCYRRLELSSYHQYSAHKHSPPNRQHLSYDNCLEVCAALYTSVSETIRKPLLLKAQTAFKKQKIEYGEKNDCQYGGRYSYTLQCGTIMTVISPGDCKLQCGMWLWNHDSEFTKWQHPAMWYVALGWYAIEFAQTLTILKFYIWFRFRLHHRSRYVVLHQSAKFYPNWTTLSRIILTSCRFSRWRISAILDFRGPIIGSLKSPCTTSYRWSIETIALNC